MATLSSSQPQIFFILDEEGYSPFILNYKYISSELKWLVASCNSESTSGSQRRVAIENQLPGLIILYV